MEKNEFSDGHYCSQAQIWVILPVRERKKSYWNDNLVVGNPGFDGVEFQIAEGSPEVLALYPNTDEIGVIASDLEDLVKKWNTDSIDYPF